MGILVVFTYTYPYTAGPTLLASVYCEKFKICIPLPAINLPSWLLATPVTEYLLEIKKLFCNSFDPMYAALPEVT